MSREQIRREQHRYNGDAIRRALLQRLVDDVVHTIRYRQELWPCCWVHYTNNKGEKWIYPLCADGCDHWHHQMELFLA